MNYIAEINAFYICQVENPTSVSSQALWHRLMAYCNGFNWKKDFTLTNTRLVEDLGISRLELDRARNALCQAGYISYKKGKGNQCGTYQINSLVYQKQCNFDTQPDTQPDTQTEPLNKLNKTKLNETINNPLPLEKKTAGNSEKNKIYSDIIFHLNSKANTNYRASGDNTKSLINSRIKEGYTLDDFKTVIDKKCAEWKGTEWAKFLRPETLFCKKHFESYLNQLTAPKRETSYDLDKIVEHSVNNIPKYKSRKGENPSE